jgi:hypothetical protein
VVIVENIYQRLKTLSLLQVETARVLLPQKTSSSFKAQEAINMKANRREYLLRQSETLSRWVCDFRKMWNES